VCVFMLFLCRWVGGGGDVGVNPGVGAVVLGACVCVSCVCVVVVQDGGGTNSHYSREV
jgi:hypothetical protein